MSKSSALKPRMKPEQAASPNLTCVTVMVAHNDDNGTPSGRAAALEIEMPEGRFIYEGAGVYGVGDGPVCRVDEHNGRLRLGRFQYRWDRHGTHVGNIVWDAFRLSELEARRLKEDQERSGWWQLIEGPVLEPATVA
jgi:hypothetical protein